QPDLAERVFRSLENAQIRAENFEIGVTETGLLSKHPENVLAILNRFHETGISIALDDFGTGFASLSHRKHFPVDHIKIDRSFVQNLEQDGDDHAIVSAIIDLGRSLNMRVTAEGIEKLEQARLLRDLGCQYAQGHLFAKPLAASHIPDLLRS